MTHRIPQDTGVTVLVRCPDCGQMEWWDESELSDHGHCRSRGQAALDDCEACGAY